MLDQFLPPPVGAVGDDAETVREQSTHHLYVRQQPIMDAHPVEPAQRLIGVEGYGANAAIVQRPRVNLGYAVDLLIGAKFELAGKRFTE